MARGLTTSPRSLALNKVDRSTTKLTGQARQKLAKSQREAGRSRLGAAGESGSSPCSTRSLDASAREQVEDDGPGRADRMVADLKLAITGAPASSAGACSTLALGQGHEVRALTRRPQPARDGVTWIDGSLDRPEQPRAAGRRRRRASSTSPACINADAAGFEAGNVTGTAAMLDAAEQAGSPALRPCQLARRPRARAVDLRRDQGAVGGAGRRLAAVDFAIVRPPAVYGPGDRETLELFRMARRGLVLLPPEGRLSLIHVDDLARLLLALADPAAPSGLLIEPDDGRPGGWSHESSAGAGQRGRAAGS